MGGKLNFTNIWWFEFRWGNWNTIFKWNYMYMIWLVQSRLWWEQVGGSARIKLNKLTLNWWQVQDLAQGHNTFLAPGPDPYMKKDCLMFLACINLSLFCHYLVLALRSVNAFYNTCSSYVSVKLSSLFLRSFVNCDVNICIKYLLGMLWFWNLQIISVTALNQYLLMWLQKVCINVLLTWCVSAHVR